MQRDDAARVASARPFWREHSLQTVIQLEVWYDGRISSLPGGPLLNALRVTKISYAVDVIARTLL